MTGIDILVHASRPRGITDSLACHLGVQVARNDRLVSEVSVLTAQVERLKRDADGYLEANTALWKDSCDVRRENYLLREQVRALGGVA